MRSFSFQPITPRRSVPPGMGPARRRLRARAGEPRAIASPTATCSICARRKGWAMVRRALLWIAALSLTAALALRAADAQGPQEWIKRILDPATIGVTMPPGAVMNRKLTVD